MISVLPTLGRMAKQAPGTEQDDEADATAEAQMRCVQRAFAVAKSAGVPAAARLMKELRRVCVSGSFEVRLNEDAPQPLQSWILKLYEFNFDEDSPLSEDLAELSSQRDDDDLTPLCLLMKFPDDFPFSAPLVFVSTPTLKSGSVLDGALCMEMLVEWQAAYGNIEAMLVQICAFLATNARIASLVPPTTAGPSVQGQRGPVDESAAKLAYERLRGIHEKKGWAPVDKDK